MYIRIYTYANSSLPKAQYFNLVLALQARLFFLEWGLARFGKELFMGSKSDVRPMVEQLLLVTA